VKRDLIFSVLTQLIVLTMFLVSYKLIAYFYGKSSFEEYSLIKRDITFILSFLGLGLYTAIMRYSSFYKNKNIYVLISFQIIFIFIFSIVIIVLFLFHDFKWFNFFFEKIFKIDNFYLLLAAFVSLFGMYAHNNLYAYLRGISNHKFANGFDIYNKAFIPIISIIFSKNIIYFFFLHGLLQIINTSIITIYFLNKNGKSLSLRKIVLIIKKLIFYGVKRIGADVGINILLFLPIIFSSNLYAGKIAFAITLLTINGYFFTPLGGVILPKIVYIYKYENKKKLHDLIIKIIFFILFLSVLLMLFFIFSLDKILYLYIGKFDNAFYINCFIILFSIVPFVFYLVLKNIIDALSIKGINSFNIFLSIIIYLICIFIFENFQISNKESLAFVISIYFLGFLTLCKIFKMIKVSK